MATCRLCNVEYSNVDSIELCHECYLKINDTELIRHNLIKYDVNTEEQLAENIEIEIISLIGVYYVDCYKMSEDFDTYSIRVYKTDCQELSDETEVSHCYLDSGGGGLKEEEVAIYLDDNTTRLTAVEDYILKLLYDEDKGLVNSRGVNHE